MTQRTLIKRGRVLTMTGPATEFAADVLVDGNRIAAIAPTLTADDAVVIDADGAIVCPGFVDTHRHVWQTQLRTIAADWSLFDYFTRMRLGYASFYAPEDVWLGNHVGALEALDAGVTSIVDHCHIINSPEHADAAIAGLDDAGIRAVFCYGLFANPRHHPFTLEADSAWRYADARRIRTRLAAADGRIVMGLAPGEAEGTPFPTTVREILLGRELAVHRISCHVAMGGYDHGARFVERLARAGYLADDLLFVHGAALTDAELGLLRDAGAGVASTPESELQMGMGFPVAIRARDAGVRAGLGVDIVSNCAGDMFLPMRLALQATRAAEHALTADRGETPLAVRLGVADALRLGTVGGAEVAGLADRVGTIAVGKRADLVVIKTDAIHMTPATDAVAAVVLNARPSDIDTVLVDGRVVKRGGLLVGVDWPSLASRLVASRDRILAGFRTADVEALRARFAPAFARGPSAPH